MLNYRKIIVLSALVAVSYPVLADIDSSGYQFNAFVGPTITTITPGTLQFPNEIDAVKPYYNNRQQTDATWGLGAAYRFILPASFVRASLLHDITLGLDFFYFQTVQRGNAWSYLQPVINSYSYHLPVKSSRLLVDSEWTFLPIASRVYPFIEGGIGFANNRASYSDTPVITNIALNGVNIAGHTQTQFAYTIGLGLKTLLTEQFALSFRFLYAGVGNTSTSTRANLPLLAPLTSSVSTQAWLFGLTYLI